MQELGYPEEGIRLLEKAMRRSPHDPNVGHWLGKRKAGALAPESLPTTPSFQTSTAAHSTSEPVIFCRKRSSRKYLLK